MSRERVVPVIQLESGQLEARWAAALSSSEDAGHVAGLARCRPPAAYALPVPGGGELDAWAPEPLLRAFFDAVVDARAGGARRQWAAGTRKD